MHTWITCNIHGSSRAVRFEANPVLYDGARVSHAPEEYLHYYRKLEYLWRHTSKYLFGRDGFKATETVGGCVIRVEVARGR